MKNIYKTFIEQQRKDNLGPYQFRRKTDRQGDTLLNDGWGSPVNPVGLIVSSFRPSDDATLFGFLIPSNLFAITSLRQLAEMVREINTAISPATDPSKALAQACLDRFLELCDVLGIPFGSDSSEDPEAKAIEEKIAARQAARKAKNWARADQIREELKAMGFAVEDSKEGAKLKRL